MKKQLGTLWEIFIYTAFIILIGGLLVSGKITLYLHPKMIKYLVLALVVLVVIDVYWIYGFFKEKGMHRSFRYTTMLFLLPLMAAVLNPSEINGTVLQNKTISVREVNAMTQDKEEIDQPITENDKDKEASAAEYDITSTEDAKALLGIEDAPTIFTPDSTSEVSSEATASDDEEENSAKESEASEADTLEQVSEVSKPDEGLEQEETDERDVVAETMSPETAEAQFVEDYWSFLFTLGEEDAGWLGKRVAVEGFVFRDEGDRENIIILSRLVMSCCAADAYVAGIYVKGDGVADLELDNWVRITGTIVEDAVYNPYTDSYNMVPLLVPDTIESIDPYDNPYIYPQ